MNFAQEFNEKYAEHEELIKRCDAAEQSGDRDAESRAINDLQAFNGRLNAKGRDYASVYWDYARAKDSGNEYIDIRDVVWDSDVPKLIDRMKKYGIEWFTFSSTWSGAVKTAWLFIENGCTLEGIVQINYGYNPIAEEVEKIPAYLFKIGR